MSSNGLILLGLVATLVSLRTVVSYLPGKRDESFRKELSFLLSQMVGALLFVLLTSSV